MLIILLDIYLYQFHPPPHNTQILKTIWISSNNRVKKNVMKTTQHEKAQTGDKLNNMANLLSIFAKESETKDSMICNPISVKFKKEQN